MNVMWKDYTIREQESSILDIRVFSCSYIIWWWKNCTIVKSNL